MSSCNFYNSAKVHSAAKEWPPDSTQRSVKWNSCLFFRRKKRLERKKETEEEKKSEKE